MINKKNKILAMVLSSMLTTSVFSSVTINAAEPADSQSNTIEFSDNQQITTEPPKSDTEPTKPDDGTEVSEPGNEAEVPNPGDEIEIPEPTEDELYLSAYTLTAEAINSKTQKSINLARKELEILPESLNWAKSEFSKQLDIVQDNLMKTAIEAYYSTLESGEPDDIYRTNEILNDIVTSEDKLISAWAQSIKHQVKLVAYNQAVKEAHNTIYSLPNVSDSLKEKSKLKIAFWGDSITEGADNALSDTYPELFINDLKNMMPNVEIEYTNFALGGRQTYNANDEKYKAADEEHFWHWMGSFVDFHRDWSVTDKSWKQHITDYKPDLLIVAFGMNDATNNLSDFSYINNVDSMLNYVKENSPDTDIALVSTMMPTENKNLYSQSTEYTLQIARATREYAKLNNIPLIDTNRLWNILLYGRDEEKSVTEEITDIEALDNIKGYNFELQVELNDLENPDQSGEPNNNDEVNNTDNTGGTNIIDEISNIFESIFTDENNSIDETDSVDDSTNTDNIDENDSTEEADGETNEDAEFVNITEIAVRSDEKQGGILFKFNKSKEETYIDIYSMDNGMDKEGIKIGTVKANEINNIKFDGAFLTVNKEAFVLYKHLREGSIKIPAGKENIKSIKLLNNKFFTQEPLYTELDMLGEVNNNIASGNGINHPTAQGTKLSYYEACQSLVNSIKAEYKKVSGKK